MAEELIYFVITYRTESSYIHIIVISILQLDLFPHSAGNQLFSHLPVARISPKDFSNHIVFPFSNVLSDLFPQGLAQFTLVNHFLLIVSACSFPICLCFNEYRGVFLVISFNKSCHPLTALSTLVAVDFSFRFILLFNFHSSSS